MSSIKSSLSRLNWRLYAALLFMGLCPAIYTTVRTFFLGQMPGEWSYSIAGQLSWVNLLYEIMDEAIHSGVDSFLAKPLFASNVLDELERIARKNSMSLFKEKKRAELKGRRILMAEDVFVNAEIMKQIILLREAEIDHAENGRIALEMFENSQAGYYDAILMDVRMPEMDGLEAAAAIRALDRPDAGTIPIIALTANAFDEDVQRSLQVGMDAHLSKPVDPEHLYQILEELIWESDNNSN